MTDSPESHDFVGLAADIVAAFVSSNSVAVSELPGLIDAVHKALVQASGGVAPVAPVEPEKPAVPVKRSITPDYLICLEDGKKFKSLKRHLRTAYGMTPEQYRQKWNLPADYPMVAPNYAASRSELAKNMGLGQRRQKEEPPAPAPKRAVRKPRKTAGA